eukprot:6188789-Pleurochrysis_carterae.AAC.2
MAATAGTPACSTAPTRGLFRIALMSSGVAVSITTTTGLAAAAATADTSLCCAGGNVVPCTGCASAPSRAQLRSVPIDTTIWSTVRASCTAAAIWSSAASHATDGTPALNATLLLARASTASKTFQKRPPHTSLGP